MHYHLIPCLPSLFLGNKGKRPAVLPPCRQGHHVRAQNRESPGLLYPNRARTAGSRTDFPPEADPTRCTEKEGWLLHKSPPTIWNPVPLALKYRGRCLSIHRSLHCCQHSLMCVLLRHKLTVNLSTVSCVLMRRNSPIYQKCRYGKSIQNKWFI